MDNPSPKPTSDNPHDRHERHDCLHCSIVELLIMAGRTPTDVLVAVGQVAGEMIAKMAREDGADAHEIMGQTVGVISYAIGYFVCNPDKIYL